MASETEWRAEFEKYCPISKTDKMGRYEPLYQIYCAGRRAQAERDAQIVLNFSVASVGAAAAIRRAAEKE